MRLLTYLVSAKYISSQSLPNGMPVPPHLIGQMDKENIESDNNDVDDLPPSHLVSNSEAYYNPNDYGQKNYMTNYDSYSNENDYHDGAGQISNTYNEFSNTLSFEEPQLSYDDFVFTENAVPLVIGFSTLFRDIYRLVPYIWIVCNGRVYKFINLYLSINLKF